jgi:hypothetical protein
MPLMQCACYIIRRFSSGWPAQARGRDTRMQGPSRAALEDMPDTETVSRMISIYPGQMAAILSWAINPDLKGMVRQKKELSGLCCCLDAIIL